MKSLEHREAEAKDKAQRLLTRARHETGVNSPEENAELMQVGGCVVENERGGKSGTKEERNEGMISLLCVSIEISFRLDQSSYDS